MLGTIEDLEKDIEQFQKNVAASGEMVELLQQLLEQLKKQNADFDTDSRALISRMDSLPSTIEDANATNNIKVKNDIATEFDRVLKLFVDEQARYLQGLEQTKQQIQSYIDHSQAIGKSFSDNATTLITKMDAIPTVIENENIKANEQIKEVVDKLLAERNVQFVEEQEKYVSALRSTQADVKSCKEQLDSKYQEFIDTLQKMNISNLYDQNNRLKNELSKRTTILMVISVLSVIAGVLGIIF